MRRLLLLGINYEPEPTGVALPTTWWSEHLAALGWHVSVVTGVPHYPSWKRGPVQSRRRHRGIEVCHRRHYVPSRQSALRRGAYELSWVASALPEVRRHRPDAVIGVVPSLGGGVLAACAARRSGVRYGLIFQDVIGRAADQSGVPGGPGVSGAIARLELTLARGAAGVAVVAESFRSYFVDSGVDHRLVHRVRNPVPMVEVRESRQAVRARLGWGDDFVVLHSGSIGYKQGLETVLEAASRTSERSLRFVLQGDGSRRRALEAMARARRLDNVSFLPLAAEQELGSILAAADVLLLAQHARVQNMSLPSKLAAYFASGRPVVAAVASGDETAREVTRAGAGVVVAPGDPEALLAALTQLRRDPGRSRRLGEAGAAFARTELAPAAVADLAASFVHSIFPDVSPMRSDRALAAAAGT